MTTSKLLASVIKDLKYREEIGKVKYNTTMDRMDLTLKDWLKHAIEEHYDAILYLKKALVLIENPNEVFEN